MAITSNWFDRKFQFTLSNEDLPAILARLEQAPGIVKQLVKDIPNVKLTHQPDGKWSIKEQVGHLCVLESLWQGRITDFRDGMKELRAADLDNKATTEGQFNNWKITDLVKRFSNERNKTIQMLAGLGDEVKNQTSIHPRLKQPMRIIDHLYFVAEHDAHHMEKIREIIG